MTDDNKQQLKDLIHDFYQANSISDFEKEALLEFIDTSNEGLILELETCLKDPEYLSTISEMLVNARDSHSLPRHIIERDNKVLEETPDKHKVSLPLGVTAVLKHSRHSLLSYAIKSLTYELKTHKSIRALQAL